MSFLCTPKKETAIKFIQIVSFFKSEIPTLPCHLSKLYQLSFPHNSTQFGSSVLIASIISQIFLAAIESIMVKLQRLRIDTCFIFIWVSMMGKLIHFKILMYLLIGNLSQYFSKWQLAYLENLCGIDLPRIYFQTSLFSGFKIP